MRAEGVVPSVPHNPCPWLTDWLFEAGPTGIGAMGPVPLGWQEIAEWARMTGRDLLPWEAQMLRRLSVDFAAEMIRAEAADCPPPWTADQDIVANKEIVARKVKNTFGALALAQQQARKG